MKQGDLARAVALMQVCVDYEGAIGHRDAEPDAAQLAQVRGQLAKGAPRRSLLDRLRGR